MSVTQHSLGILPGHRAEKVRDVYRCLDTVVDPELDEPVTDLDFITGVHVGEDDTVEIGFRLPTYWCAPNFAFMMVDDLHRATEQLPWVKQVTVKLGEHMYSDTINVGVAEGRTFQESFGAEADGNLDEVRRTFLLKAFQRRQEALLLHLRASGYDPCHIIDMSVGALKQEILSEDGKKLVERYLQRRDVAGGFDVGSRAFVTTADELLEGEGFEIYLKNLRRVRVNAEFNGALCRGLLAVRFDTSSPPLPKSIS